MRVIRGAAISLNRTRDASSPLATSMAVHLGHQAILAAVKSQATKDGVDSMLVCFEPQPKEFFDEFKRLRDSPGLRKK